MQIYVFFAYLQIQKSMTFFYTVKFPQNCKKSKIIDVRHRFWYVRQNNKFIKKIFAIFAM